MTGKGSRTDDELISLSSLNSPSLLERETVEEGESHAVPPLMANKDLPQFREIAADPQS